MPVRCGGVFGGVTINGRIYDLIDVFVIICFGPQFKCPHLRPIIIDIQCLHDQEMKSNTDSQSNRKPRRVLAIPCNPRRRGNANAISHKMPFEPPPIA